MATGSSSRILFKVAGAMLLITLLVVPATASAGQKGAEEAVKKFSAALLENMKRGSELGFRGRYKLLDPVVREVFALEYMGEKSLGSYWKGLSPEQAKKFMDLYTDWTITSYAGNFEHYSGETFETYEGKQVNANTVGVISKIVKAHEESIEFDYTLRRFHDKWRIVDIRISGVSQLSITRSQFVTVMKDKGFDALLGLLKERIASYHSGDEK